MSLRPAAVPLLLVLAAAGCSSSASSPSRPGRSQLVVRVALFGGPMAPDGHMAMSNSPDPNATLTATDAGGRRWTAHTNATGEATFVLPAGRYRVRSSTCGGLAKTLTLSPRRDVRQTLTCDIP